MSDVTYYGRYCVNCEHVYMTVAGPVCKHPSATTDNYNPVFGKTTHHQTCEYCRSQDTWLLCGPTGRYFRGKVET